jgi:hypothetical protein
VNPEFIELNFKFYVIPLTFSSTKTTTQISSTTLELDANLFRNICGYFWASFDVRPLLVFCVLDGEHLRDVGDMFQPTGSVFSQKFESIRSVRPRTSRIERQTLLGVLTSPTRFISWERGRKQRGAVNHHRRRQDLQKYSFGKAGGQKTSVQSFVMIGRGTTPRCSATVICHSFVLLLSSADGHHLSHLISDHTVSAWT